jgi:N-glycosylase/DNA lyase
VRSVGACRNACRGHEMIADSCGLGGPYGCRQTPCGGRDQLAMVSPSRNPLLPCDDAGTRVYADAPEPTGEIVLSVGEEQLLFAWGEPHHLGTCAYWVEQTRRRAAGASFALGETLAEEVAACMLGGHGIPAEVGLAAYEAVRGQELLDRVPTAVEIEAVLAAPLRVRGRQRPARYRFARQRSVRLAAALRVLAESEPPTTALELRGWLMLLPGVGPKTASWIVRNHCGSDEVAIIDIHVRRAGVRAGFFSSKWQLPRDYGLFESAFCKVAGLGRVRPSRLDACVWDQMRALGRAQLLMLGSGPPA